MFDLIYLSLLHPGKQKSLAYAFGLAKALSAPLSLLSSASLGDPNNGKTLIWRPNVSPRRSAKKRSNRPNVCSPKWEPTPLYLLGKSNSSRSQLKLIHPIVERILGMGSPVLILPHNHPFEGIQNVLFAGNEPGLTNHRVKHLIAAAFLPSVFRIEDAALKRIHWNNIAHIPNSYKSKLSFTCPRFAAELKQHQIDLTFLPLATENPVSSAPNWDEILSINSPLLLLPLQNQVRRISGALVSLSA